VRPGHGGALLVGMLVVSVLLLLGIPLLGTGLTGSVRGGTAVASLIQLLMVGVGLALGAGRLGHVASGRLGLNGGMWLNKVRLQSAATVGPPPNNGMKRTRRSRMLCTRRTCSCARQCCLNPDSLSSSATPLWTYWKSRADSTAQANSGSKRSVRTAPVDRANICSASSLVGCLFLSRL
jgi:hypothetical protein